MLKYPESSPCPIARSGGLGFEQTSGPTKELDLPTDSQAALRQATPRRRKPIRPSAEEQKHVLRGVPSVKVGNPYMRANYPPHDRGRYQQSMDCKTRKAPAGSMPARQWVSLFLAEMTYGQSNHTEICENQRRVTRQDAIHTHKKPRRQTIYVPSDDTTILTINPGLQSDARELNDLSLSFNHSNLVKYEVQGNRKPLAAAPKRAPLQPTLKPLQENENNVDIAGTGSGKENMPPAWPDAKSPVIKGSKARRLSNFVAAPDGDAVLPDRFVDCNRRSAKDKPPNSAATSGGLGSKLSRFPRECAKTKAPRDPIMNLRNSTCYRPKWKPPVESNVKQSTARLPSRLAAPVLGVGNVTKQDEHPVSSEDIDQPAMLEETWLNDQQAAIQQLINGLFEATQEGKSTPPMTHGEIRQTLLRLYQGSECSLLYKRIQASLSYGALSPPKGAFAEILRLRHDLGFRQKFVAIWTKSYDLETLHAAAEVVIGLELTIRLPDTSISGQQHRGTSRTRRKQLEDFIYFCLLRNEDTLEHQQSSSAWCWRRTILRSLMMIFLVASTFSVHLVPDLETSRDLQWVSPSFLRI